MCRTFKKISENQAKPKMAKVVLFDIDTFECICTNIDLHCRYILAYIKILRVKSRMCLMVRSIFLNVNFHGLQNKWIKSYLVIMFRLNHFQQEALRVSVSS